MEQTGFEARMRSAQRVLMFCFFFSGFTGLLYQIVWVRMFSLVFGNTTYAISAVLAAFMAGLGLGSFAAGKFIEGREGAPLYYGVLEGLIGVYALVIPFALAGMERMYPSLYAAFHVSAAQMTIVKLVAAFILLIIPTFCMGTSLPLMARFYSSRKIGVLNFGDMISQLYAVNTFGAVLGAFITGMRMIPMLGLHRTLLMGAVINTGIFLLAALQHLKLKGIPAEEIRPAPDAPERAGKRGFALLILLSVFTTGFTAMLMEVAWTRALVMIVNSSTYSFTLILTTFLLGIAIGGWFAGALYRRVSLLAASRSTLLLPGLCVSGVAVSCALGLPMVNKLIVLVGTALPVVSQDPKLLYLLNFFVCCVILLVPAILFGAAFPVAVELYRLHTGKSAGSVGPVYAVNTVGAIFGSLVTGFWLIPAFGLERAIQTGVLAALAVGIILLLADGASSFLKRAALAAATGAVALFIITRPGMMATEYMTSGAYMYYTARSPEPVTERIRKSKESHRPLFVADGLTANVAVFESGKDRFLRINGKTDASTRNDMGTQLYLGYFPVFLHKGPVRSAAIIGFGSGTTAGAVLRAGAQSATVIEIEPNVIRAGRFFGSINGQCLRNPKLRVVTEDARNYFLGHREKFDVIVSEPSNTWMAGIGNLFSVEHFRATKAHLKPGGVMCQWIHLYQASPGLISVIFSSFTSVYPQTYAFRSLNDLILIGSDGPLDLDPDSFARKFNDRKLGDIFPKLGLLNKQPAYFYSSLYLEPKCVRSLSNAFITNTDDLPFIEFQSPIDMFSSKDPIWAFFQCRVKDPLKTLGAVASKMKASDYLDFAEAIHVQGTDSTDVKLERDAIRKAIELEPNNARAWRDSAQYYKQNNSPISAAAAFLKAIEIDPRDDISRRSLGGLLFQNEQFEQALKTIAPLTARPLPDPSDLFLAGDCLMNLNRYNEAETHFRKILSRISDPRQRSLANRRIAFMKNTSENKTDSFNFLENAFRENPGDAGIIFMYAEALLDKGRAESAARALENTPTYSRSSPQFTYLSNRILRVLNRDRKLE